MSPRTKAQFEAIRSKSKQSIKEAALELFGHLGYHSTSISRIAKEAGVSKGLLYNYFDSKEALLQEILMDSTRIADQIFQGVMESTPDPYDRLRAIVEVSFSYVLDNIYYWKLLTAVAFQTEVLEDLVPQLREKQIEANEGIIHLFEQTGKPDARQEALLFSAAMDGLFIQYLQMGEAYPLEEMKQYMIERFCS